MLTDSAQVRTQAHKCTFEQPLADSVTHIHPGFSTLHCTLQCWCSSCVICLAAKMRHVRDQECERQPCKTPPPPVSWSHDPLTLLPSTHTHTQADVFCERCKAALCNKCDHDMHSANRLLAAHARADLRSNPGALVAARASKKVCASSSGTTLHVCSPCAWGAITKFNRMQQLICKATAPTIVAQR